MKVVANTREANSSRLTGDMLPPPAPPKLTGFFGEEPVLTFSLFT
jgi:hypothetical protein